MKMCSVLWIILFLLNTQLTARHQPLYAPWRTAHLNTIAQQPKNTECPFCSQIAAHTDNKYFILWRSEHVVVMLNKYPYGTGHIMIIPTVHHSRLSDCNQITQHEIMQLMSASVDILQQELHMHGCNVGINLGSASGASIPDHLHVHILPRWSADYGFIQTIGETAVIVCDLEDMYTRLKPHFDQLKID